MNCLVCGKPAKQGLTMCYKCISGAIPDVSWGGNLCYRCNVYFQSYEQLKEHFDAEHKKK